MQVKPSRFRNTTQSTFFEKKESYNYNVNTGIIEMTHRFHFQSSIIAQYVYSNFVRFKDIELNKKDL